MADQRMIGHYEIKDEIGRGGMATVYRAYDPRVKREVAIKLLPREFDHDPTFRARFEREAQTIAGLEHSAIVPVHDFGKDAGQSYLVMRYMPGGSLSDRISKGPLDASDIAAIMRRIGAALDSAHSQGIIHRDVKPGNILFDRHGDAYLSDFGIVKLADPTAQLSGSGVVGTPAYMAPEMSKPDGLTPLVDVYGLAVTLYEMLTGKPPFKAPTPLGLLMAHMNEPIPDIRAARRDLPDALQEVIERGLAKDPRQRTQSAGALADDLTTALAGELPITSQGTKPTAKVGTPPTDDQPAWTVPIATPSPAGRRALPIWARIGAGATVLILVIGGIVLFGGNPTSAVTPTLPEVVAPCLTNTPPDKTRARIAFTFYRDSNFDIFSVGADGSGLSRLTNNPAVDQQPDWSPDGSQIAFISFRGGDAAIYVMNADGSCQTLLEPFPGSEYPVWSPDGKRIAFRSSSTSNPGLFVINREGDGLTRLTDYDVWDSKPDWSPDGSQIAFLSEHTGDINVYVVSAKGGSPVNLTHDTFRDASPTWSPDGSKIAFVTDHDDPNWSSCTPACNTDIFVMNADGSGQIRLTNSKVTDIYPAWSPDSKRIAYVSAQGISCGCPQALYVIDADGSHQSLLVDNTVNNDIGYYINQPAWSPDGSLLAFEIYYKTYATLGVIPAAGGSVTNLTDHEPFPRQGGAAPVWLP